MPRPQDAMLHRRCGAWAVLQVNVDVNSLQCIDAASHVCWSGPALQRCMPPMPAASPVYVCTHACMHVRLHTYV